MTYTFKLARRLAVSREGAVLAMIALVAACTGDTTTAPNGAEPITSFVAALSVSPRKVTAEINQPIQFRGLPRDARGFVRSLPTVWSSTGGRVTANGTFFSATVGTFKVIGRGRGWRNADTAVVTVVPTADSVTRIVVSPSALSLTTGDTSTFKATAYLADGSTATVGVNWAETGGAIDAGGTYTAGSSAGTYHVIAANTAGTVADTSTVTISAPASAPAPTLTAVYVTPTSASLLAGASKQFRAYGRTTTGDSVAVSVTFAATGGTVTSSGLYTAGTAGGSFRVVAKEPVTGEADTSAIAIAVSSPPPPPPPSSTATGIPFGPFGLWNTTTSVKWGPAPFTLSLQQNSPGSVVALIGAARSTGQKLVLCLAGCAHTPLLTNGAFDLAKWKAAIDAYNTTTIRQTIAQAVSDGTVIGNDMMDEPEHSSWGGVVTKPMLDQMATYAKQYFPTLPMGVNYGHGAAYTWRTAEILHVVDFTISQYSYNVNKGDVSTYRSNVLNRAQLEGWTPAFSLNLLDGGVQDTDGTWDCAGISHTGTYSPNCWMTAAQVKTWGASLAGAGCALLGWRYDAGFVAYTDNQQAFSDLATRTAALPGRSCRRA